MKIWSSVVCCLALGGACSVSRAESVRYGFDSQVSSWSDQGFGPFQFEFDRPGFILNDTTVPASAMRHCSMAGALCDKASFFMDSRAAGFSPDVMNAMLFKVHYPDGYSITAAYYFPVGTFGSYGSFEAGGNIGTLTISAVPEPAAWLGLLAGLAVLAAHGAVSRHARIRSAIPPS